MMVSILVDIEKGEYVENMVGFNRQGEHISTIDRNKVSRAENSIHMDDHEMCVMINRRGLHHPHSGAVIWCISDLVEPADNCTWIVYTPKSKGKKSEYLCNIHALHSMSIWVSNDEHTIFACMPTSPLGGYTNIFMFHPPNPTQIARCEEHQYCRIKDLYLPVKLRAVYETVRHFSRVSFIEQEG
jgi:hypothetical protein